MLEAELNRSHLTLVISRQEATFMEYRDRIADHILKDKLESFGGVLILGPKGCGKTTTAKHFAKSFIEFQNEENREKYLTVVEAAPSRLLIGEKPRLFDERQDAPKIWGAIRKNIDDEQDVGSYILTGSSAMDLFSLPHTGTMRISRMEMYPMSLFESGESNGSVSLSALFDKPDSFLSCSSGLSFGDLLFALCRGGWPIVFRIPKKENRLNVAKDLFRQTCAIDVSSVDGIKRNPVWAETILKSYARNLCTLADDKTIYDDVESATGISEKTMRSYIEALKRLFIIGDIDAWSPSIRSKTAIRSQKKRCLIDPSIAVAALGLTPEYFNADFKTLGFLFECLCIRDLRIYSQKRQGRISYYRDRYGLEADCVLHLENGQYALIEFKIGGKEIDAGAKHLCKIEELIKEKNEKETQTPFVCLH